MSQQKNMFFAKAYENAIQIVLGFKTQNKTS